MKRNVKLPSNPLELIIYLSKLDKKKKKIIEYILQDDRRRVTPEQLITEFGDEVLTTLKELQSEGIIRTKKYLNFEFYELTTETISYRLREKFPVGPVIPLIYHHNLLSDTNRLNAFSKAINKTVEEGDLVLEVGTGSAILSLLAAKAGGFVYSVEVDPLVIDAAEYFVKSSGYGNKITLIDGDVLASSSYMYDWRFDLIKNIDFNVVICEMLDTALINELQVPVINYIHEHFKVDKSRFIPLKSYTYVQLAAKDYNFEGFNFPLIHYEAYGARTEKKVLSERVLYHEADFRKFNDTEVSFDIPIKITQDGVINSIILTTDVELYEGYIVHGSDWFNPPMVLPYKEIQVRKGDKVNLKMSYILGGGFSTIKYSIEI